MNYWGYSTVGFFSPKAGYAATGRTHDGTMVADEFKSLVKELHRNGIEVILDVVFNHTAEGNEHGPTISYRGIDNSTYYMLTPEGYYYNFSGTGNTLNCNNPIVRDMVLDALALLGVAVPHRRFSLRPRVHPQPGPVGGADGQPAPSRGARLRPHPWKVQADRRGVGRRRTLPGRVFPGLRALGGVERQVSRHPAPVSQGRPRRDRRHERGDSRLTPDVPRARDRRRRSISSPAMTASTLADLVSYNGKHNEANGEDNRDGANDNDSWNCGWEGPTEDAAILDSAPAPDEERYRDAAGQPGRAHDPDGRRIRSEQARQQQHLLPG